MEHTFTVGQKVKLTRPRGYLRTGPEVSPEQANKCIYEITQVSRDSNGVEMVRVKTKDEARPYMFHKFFAWRFSPAQTDWDE